MKYYLYAVQNSSGQYLRTKGYNGLGECWIDDLTRAKTWWKESTAKAQITWWARNYPEYPVPKLAVLEVDIYDIIDQQDRVTAANRKKEIADTRAGIQYAEYEKERAVREIARANEKLKRAEEILCRK